MKNLRKKGPILKTQPCEHVSISRNFKTASNLSPVHSPKERLFNNYVHHYEGHRLPSRQETQHSPTSMSPRRKFTAYLRADTPNQTKTHTRIHTSTFNDSIDKDEEKGQLFMEKLMLAMRINETQRAEIAKMEAREKEKNECLERTTQKVELLEKDIQGLTQSINILRNENQQLKNQVKEREKLINQLKITCSNSLNQSSKSAEVEDLKKQITSLKKNIEDQKIRSTEQDKIITKHLADNKRLEQSIKLFEFQESQSNEKIRESLQSHQLDLNSIHDRLSLLIQSTVPFPEKVDHFLSKSESGSESYNINDSKSISEDDRQRYHALEVIEEEPSDDLSQLKEQINTKLRSLEEWILNQIREEENNRIREKFRSLRGKFTEDECLDNLVQLQRQVQSEIGVINQSMSYMTKDSMVAKIELVESMHDRMVSEFIERQQVSQVLQSSIMSELNQDLLRIQAILPDYDQLKVEVPDIPQDQVKLNQLRNKFDKLLTVVVRQRTELIRLQDLGNPIDEPFESNKQMLSLIEQ